MTRDTEYITQVLIAESSRHAGTQCHSVTQISSPEFGGSYTQGREGWGRDQSEGVTSRDSVTAHDSLSDSVSVRDTACRCSHPGCTNPVKPDSRVDAKGQKRWCSAACRVARHRSRPPRTGPRPISMPQARAQRAPTRALLRDLLDSNAELLSEPGVAEALVERPGTWGECRGKTGPCPYVGCPGHRYLDVNPDNGTIKLNFPHLEPLDLEEPCVFRTAERGPLTLEQTGERLNLTRERVRQIEVRALLKLKAHTERPDEPPTQRWAWELGL